MGRSNLFIYLTGEGDGKGGMTLLDGTSIDRAYIDLCLRELEENHQGGLAQTPVVQFDMCRYGVDPGRSIAVLGMTNKGIDAFYSCSAGEGALAMEFSPETLLSAYSIAFIMASCDLARSSSNSPHESTTADLDTLKKAIQWRLHQLTNVVNLARRSGRPSGIFHMIFYMLSKSSSIFKLPDLIPQSPDWGEASNLDLIIELSLMISEMKQVRQVYDKITNHIYFRMANPPLVSTSNHDPPPRTRTTQHHRGASPNVLLANSQRKSNIIEA
ncbi:hypothetical protein BN14_11310 [Rhizoctonia solani AG-1 IB]|uniref:Uncharacterized protein n=1 Tax=Thanatephorus cucumeris (strain AG1-IB / isolate 7/3/14) TaxID=1108050 RepID=M5CB01_THACB|nr:hypothetical protein BN14_11310 [Rhizoctonia solani AG-1 IB]